MRILNTSIIATALVFSMLMVSGCAETELASHLVKQVPHNPNARTYPVERADDVGAFKVGNSYKIAGKRYHPRETYSFEQTGKASWYGPNFHGKKTANGEIFDQNALTAAHRTLQMPSLIRVTNLDNGRSAILRVNDRGPFSKGRVLDVSKGGAKALGFINQGTAHVKIQLLPDESRQAADAAKRGLDTTGMEVALNQRTQTRVMASPVQQHLNSSGPLTRAVPGSDVRVASSSDIVGDSDFFPAEATNYNFPDEGVQRYAPPAQIIQGERLFVQAGSFGDQVRAEHFAQSLASIGRVQVDGGDLNGRMLYRVRIPVQNRSEALQVVDRLAALGQDDAIIVAMK